MTIRLPKPQNLPRAYALLESDAKKHSIQFAHDADRGSGSSHGFAGEHVIQGDKIIVTVTKKLPLINKNLATEKVGAYWAQICEKAQ